MEKGWGWGGRGWWWAGGKPEEVRWQKNTMQAAGFDPVQRPGRAAGLAGVRRKRSCRNAGERVALYGQQVQVYSKVRKGNGMHIEHDGLQWRTQDTNETQ